MRIRLVITALLASLTLTMVGCAKEEGPMEKMGKSLDETAENVKDAAEDVAEDVADATEDAAENVKEEVQE